MIAFVATAILFVGVSFNDYENGGVQSLDDVKTNIESSFDNRQAPKSSDFNR